MPHSKNNQATLNVYNREFNAYILNTPQDYSKSPSFLAMLKWIDRGLERLKPEAKILEIGSATPRDATYMRAKGFIVQCSDACAGFIEYMNTLGEEAMELDILDPPAKALHKSYDLIFANAVFPHFSDKDVHTALIHISQLLTPNGTLLFNVKNGKGDTWLNERTLSKRYMNYQTPESIVELLKKAGFQIIELDESGEGLIPTHQWIRIIATIQ